RAGIVSDGSYLRDLGFRINFVALKVSLQSRRRPREWYLHSEVPKRHRAAPEVPSRLWHTGRRPTRHAPDYVEIHSRLWFRIQETGAGGKRSSAFLARGLRRDAREQRKPSNY